MSIEAVVPFVAQAIQDYFKLNSDSYEAAYEYPGEQEGFRGKVISVANEEISLGEIRINANGKHTFNQQVRITVSQQPSQGVYEDILRLLSDFARAFAINQSISVINNPTVTHIDETTETLSRDNYIFRVVQPFVIEDLTEKPEQGYAISLIITVENTIDRYVWLPRQIPDDPSPITDTPTPPPPPRVFPGIEGIHTLYLTVPGDPNRLIGRVNN